MTFSVRRSLVLTFFSALQLWDHSEIDEPFLSYKESSKRDVRVENLFDRSK